ncbi:cytochrome c biogenesis protein ResB [Gordonia alkaliphila]|uniref:Cytochrome c biogenesis protein ResB n=1 Tax=Gordonia alkaliphila TaxID=1053547 RepID=A0ABP8Z294_9ACTN
MTTKTYRPSPVQRFVVTPLRKVWRELTAMRTALVLLFLLALAAVPGALLPQRDLNEGKTAQYIADRGTLGVWMDKVGLFDVFGSGWFTAIYLLLFISLVGCLTPRIWEHFQALRTQPVPAPRNLTRLPRHITETVDGAPAELAERVTANLRGWRRTTRELPASKAYPDGAVEVSAEKGYLREFGNLTFHFALLALLVTIAAGKMFGYEGTRILVAGDDQMLCNTSTAVYDSFRAGAMVDGTDLSEFCVKVENFEAKFLDTGQPDMYTSQVRYTTDIRSPQDTWEQGTIRVNEPLRVAGDRVYVLGNGYAPTFTVTFPNGETRTQTAPFLPQDTQTMLSEGAMRFETPAGMFPDEDERRKNQIAVDGLFAPDPAFHSTLLLSQSPIVNDPQVAVRVYQGDAGLDTGQAQSVYELDRRLIDQGRLVRKASVNLKQGESATLPDGTKVTYDGYRRWVSMQVSHDPGQTSVLVSAIVMIAGLLVSMLVRRRRIWIRLVPAVTEGDQRRTVVEVAGLARTDQAGWGEGFDEQARALLVEGGRLRPGGL